LLDIASTPLISTLLGRSRPARQVSLIVRAQDNLR
jgi:hypothetical protein